MIRIPNVGIRIFCINTQKSNKLMEQIIYELGGEWMKDDRHQFFNKKSENARTLGKMIENTKANIKEAEISKEFAGPEELENIEEKNAHRKTAINQMEEQIKEKRAFQNWKDSFK